jgi:hypothetical protein
MGINGTTAVSTRALIKQRGSIANNNFEIILLCARTQLCDDAIKAELNRLQ